MCLIKCYLTNRTQITEITQICKKTRLETKYSSAPIEVGAGVPQGSVLGPLLFLIKINDFPKVTLNDMVMFADDSTLIGASKNSKTLQMNMTHDLKNIINWLNHNNLKINLFKTKYMTFRNRVPLADNMSIEFEDQKIYKTEVTKFLGVFIDSQMSWKPQIEAVCNRLNQFAYALNMLSKVVTYETVLVAYHSYVASALRYGVIFWGNSSHKEFAFKAQKRCIRSIFKISKLESCKPLFINYKLLTLPCIYIYETVSFVKANLDLFENLRSDRCQYNLCALPHKTAWFGKSICGMATTIFNKLPKHVKQIQNINIFKSEIKKLLIDKAYYNISEYLNDVLLSEIA